MKRLRLIALIVALATAMVLSTEPAGAHRFFNPCATNLTWPDGDVSFGTPTGSFTQEVRNAWELAHELRNRTPGGFRFNTPNYDENYFGRANGDPEAWFTTNQDYLQGHPAMAMSTFGCLFFNDVDIVFDKDQAWTYQDTASSNRTYRAGPGTGRNFLSGAIHEMGHAVGLAHETRYYNVMGSDATHIERNGDVITVSPGEDAIRGETRLYGIGTPGKDISVSHWKHTGESEGYSSHGQTGIFDDDGAQMPFDSVDGVRRITVRAGQSYNVQFTFSNNGVPGTWDFDVPYALYISSDNVIDTSDRLITQGTIDLYANLPDTVKLPVTIPADLAAHTTHFLGVVVDRTDSISEYAEDNNATYLGIAIAGGCGATGFTSSSDFNGDGICDLIVGAQRDGGGSITALFGRPGRFQKEISQLVNQDLIGPGHNEPGDSFGSSVATGDFDGDGFADIAVGGPFENSMIGAVDIFRGSKAGFRSISSPYGPAHPVQRFSQATVGIIGVAEVVDQFGSALAAADFNGDGVTDLAIASVGENNFQGAVNVIYGKAGSGLQASGNQVWSQDSPGVAGQAQAGDEFGRSLVAGDFNNDGIADLAVGVPGESSAKIRAGAVQLLHGSPGGGLTSNLSQFWSQDSPNIEESAEVGDRFGTALASGDVNGDGISDLAIGVPHEDRLLQDTGIVHLLFGTSFAFGLTDVADTIWEMGTGGIQGTPHKLDQFGTSLAIGDFIRDGFGDLAVGTPTYDDGSAADAGAVNVIPGSVSGLASANNQLLTISQLAGSPPEPNQLFGHSLGAGDFNSGPKDDLAIGAPGTTVTVTGGDGINAIFNAGVVRVFYGATALTDDSAVRFDQGDLWGTPGQNHFFGASVSSRSAL